MQSIRRKCFKIVILWVMQLNKQAGRTDRSSIKFSRLFSQKQIMDVCALLKYFQSDGQTFLKMEKFITNPSIISHINEYIDESLYLIIQDLSLILTSLYVSIISKGVLKVPVQRLMFFLYGIICIEKKLKLCRNELFLLLISAYCMCCPCS